MAFPSTSGSVPMTLEAGWELARQNAAVVKAQSQSLVNAASGNVSAQTIVAYWQMLQSMFAIFNQIAAISGIAAYAQTQIGSTTENISSDFSAMTTAITATIDWIETNFPKDANSNLLYVQFGANGLSYTSFTSAQLAGFVTQLNSLIATID